MKLSSQEGEIPIPINSSLTAGGNGHGHIHGHIIHHHHHQQHAPHNHIIPASYSSPTPKNQIRPINIPISTNSEEHINPPLSSCNVQKMIKYRECLKNHAAAMGGNATDGCGEFMPSGEEGTIEALTCSACNCHRNFHRKEIEGEQQQQAAISPIACYHHNTHFNRVRRKVILGHHNNILAATPEALGYPTATGTLISSSVGPTPHQMIMSYNMGSHPSESDEQGDGGGVIMAARPTAQLVKKRFRTKFTQEQKEKMFNFAEKVGWKMQKQEESVVQQFCQEIGVKRRVLKVWMHNNKHNLAKKQNNPPPPPPLPPPTTTAA